MSRLAGAAALAAASLLVAAVITSDAAEPGAPPPSPAFQQGQADRQAWETWFNAQVGEFRAGAEYWAAHRSEPSRTCAVPSRSVSPDWSAGCRAAAERLAAPDRRRKTERDYRAGWNDPVSTMPAAPAPRVPELNAPGTSFRPGQTIVQEIVGDREGSSGPAPAREANGESAVTLTWTVTILAAILGIVWLRARVKQTERRRRVERVIGKESKSAPELIKIALDEIQTRRIGHIYNVNVSASPYGSASSGMWQLIINQVPLHDGDPIRKGDLERETPSEKQWRYSLIEIEQELQSKFELQDSKITTARTGARPSSHNRPVDTVEKSFDRATVRKIVEDHWRSILPLRGYGRRPQNITRIEQMGNRLADQVEAWCDSLPPDQSKELDDMFGEEMRASVAECKRDPVAYARRLGVLPGRVYERQGIGEMALRTVVRASIWEGVRRLFWR